MQITRTRLTLRRGAAERMAPWLCAALMAAAPSTAYGQSLNLNAVQLANPVVNTQPSLSLATPSLTVQPTTILPAAPSTITTTPNLTVNALPTIEPGLIAPTVTAPATAITTRPQIGVATVATSGLGRLVAPESADSSVVVARIGSAVRTEVPVLTADFGGDGLINFEIAPGIVDMSPDSTGQDAGALGGIVGRHVTMATDTADRVLDGVINTAGIVAATTFEIQDGAVVLGGVRTTAPTVEVNIPRVPEGSATPDRDGGAGRGSGETRWDDHAGKDGNNEIPDRTVPDCVTHACDRADPAPGPNGGPSPAGPFQFSGRLRPMPTNGDFESEPGDLIDVSILIPLRGREREGDQFSNHGNEEIW